LKEKSVTTSSAYEALEKMSYSDYCDALTDERYVRRALKARAKRSVFTEPPQEPKLVPSGEGGSKSQ
jgi:hypothetical protein